MVVLSVPACLCLFLSYLLGCTFLTARFCASLSIHHFLPALRSPRADPPDPHGGNAGCEGLQPRSTVTSAGADTAFRGSSLEPQAAAAVHPQQTPPPPNSSGPAPDSAVSPAPAPIRDDGSGPAAATRVRMESIPRQDEAEQQQDRSENRSPEPESALTVPVSLRSAVSASVSTGVVGLAEAEKSSSPLAGGGGCVPGGKDSAGESTASAVSGHSEEVPGGGVCEAGGGAGSRKSPRGGAASLPEGAPRASLGAVRAASLKGGGCLLTSIPPVEAAAAGGVPEERRPGTAAAAPAPRRLSAEATVNAPPSQGGSFVANAAGSLAGGKDEYTPEAGAAVAPEQGRGSQPRSDDSFSAAASTSAGPAKTTRTMTTTTKATTVQLSSPFPLGGDRGLDFSDDSAREESRARSGALLPPARLPGGGGSRDGTVEVLRLKAGGFLRDEAAGCGDGAACLTEVRAESGPVEGGSCGAASGIAHQAAVLSTAATASSSTTGSFQSDRDAATSVGRSSGMFSRLGPSFNRAANHDERGPRPVFPTAGPHSGLDVVARNPAWGGGTKDGSPWSGKGGLKVPDLPLQGAPLKAGATEASAGVQASRPATGRVGGWRREGDGQVVMVDRGEWEALRRENDGLRRQVALSDKR